MDAHAWDDRYAAAELVWSVEPNQFVAAECADLPPGRAVDLAAGEGRNAIWLARRGWSVTAVDFSQVGLDKGRKLAVTEGTGGPQDPSVLMTAADVLDDLAGQEYDVVTAGRVARKVDDGHGGEGGRTAWDCLVRLTKR